MTQGDKKYLICNADEGDPGAFMDRALLEGDPHRVVEGMIIAAYAIGASYGYIYCRAEYPLAIERIEKTLEGGPRVRTARQQHTGQRLQFRHAHQKGCRRLRLRRGNSADSFHRRTSRHAAPASAVPAVSGLFGKPTVINNVETFANVTTVFKYGARLVCRHRYGKFEGHEDLRSVGQGCNVGLVEVPMGISLREIIFDIGGGIPDGKKFKAVQIGGPSGGALPTGDRHTRRLRKHLKQVGAMMGSGGLVVMDESTCMVDLAKYFMTFIQTRVLRQVHSLPRRDAPSARNSRTSDASHRNEKTQEDACFASRAWSISSVSPQ
jgi:NADH-quinone oxidoreductase subunit F